MKRAVVGFLMAGDRSYPSHKAFLEELALQGLRSGEALRIEERFGEGRQDRLPALADELVALGVDLLCVVGAVTLIAALRHAERIPLLFSIVLDPVAGRLVPAGAQGALITGATSYAADQPKRQVALWKRVMPRIERLGILGDAGVPPGLAEQAENAALRQGLKSVTVRIEGRDGIARALHTLREGGVQAVSVLEVPRTSTYGVEILTGLTGAGLPSMFGYDLARLGPPLAYGTSLADATRVMARQAAKVLAGVQPEDIPLETAATMRLRVDLAAASQVGLTVPENVLAEAEG